MDRSTTSPPVFLPPGLRRLAGSEGDAVAAHLLRLSPRDRVQRFCGSLSDDGVLRHAGDFAKRPALRIGYFHDDVLRGCGEVNLFLGDGLLPEGELALSVETRWQNLGIGRAMLEWLILMARNRWLPVLHLHCRADNTPMRALARHAGFRQAQSRGDVTAVLDPPPPTPLTLAREFIAGGLAFAERLWPPAGPQAGAIVSQSPSGAVNAASTSPMTRNDATS